MLNIAICDDSELICHFLVNKIESYFQGVCKDIDIKIFNSSEDFLNYNNLEKINLLFLDIEIDEKSGIDIARDIREKFNYNNINIIFISAHKEYALDLFKSRPIDFLVKPINDQNLYDVLDRFIKIVEQTSNYFKYKIKNNILLKDINSILFFESIGRKIKIVTEKDEDMFYGNLKNINEELEKFNFIQTHNSFLVNKKYITKITNTELFIKDSIRIPISRSNKDKILKLYMKG